MTALLSAFAEYLFKFVVCLAAAAIGIYAGRKIRITKDERRSAE